MKTKLQLILKMQLGFGAVLAVLLVVGVVSYRSLLASAESERWVQHTHEVLEHLESLLSAMENIETVYVRFALSGEEAFLQPSRANISLLDQEQKTLRALTADNPYQQRRLATLAGLAKQTIRHGDILVRLRQTGGRETAAEAIRKGQGERILGEFRAVTHDMEDEEHQLLLKRNVDAERRFRQTKAALILGTTSGLLIAALAGRLVQRDYAARGKSEAAFLEGEERFRLLVEGVQDYAILWLDPHGKVVSWNAGAERIEGYKADEIIGQNLSRFYLQTDIDQGKPEEELQVAVASGRSEIEHWRVRKDGSRFWANVVITAARNSSGSLLGFSEISRDISERKETEAKYRGLLEAAPDAMVVVNQPGEIVLLNLQAEKQFGYQRDELVGQRVENIIPEGFSERLLMHGTGSPDDPIVQQMGTGIELIGRRKNGSEFPLEIMLSPLESTEGILVTAAIRDISVRKKSEEALLKTVAELKRSNEELQQFAYVASHDLQEPLRMVASYTQLLAKRYKGRLDSDADEFIAYAVDGSNRMQALIQDLLAYSRAGMVGKALREISSEHALKEALTNLRAVIEESSAVVTHDLMPVITTDDMQLAQVFQNLVGNAIKYRSAEVPHVHVDAAKNGGNEWIFSVQDNGMGIDPQYFERIFILFQRLHGRKEFEGTGIGLAICKKIVERLGGRIWVESQPEKGSTFYLPCRQEMGNDGIGWNGRRAFEVLLVEDSPGEVRLTREAFTDDLPKKAGREVLEEIKERSRDSSCERWGGHPRVGD
jgi:PAS domain S-box-containing protein